MHTHIYTQTQQNPHPHTHLFLHLNIKLFDSLQSELLLLHQDADWLSHELLGHLQHVIWHGGREEDDLRVGGELPEHIIDLVLEPSRQHLISLVQDKDPDLPWICAGGWGKENAVEGVRAVRSITGVDLADLQSSSRTTTSPTGDSGVDLRAQAVPTQQCLKRMPTLHPTPHTGLPSLALVCGVRPKPPPLSPILPPSLLTESPPVDHVQYPPRGPHHHVLALLQLAKVLFDVAPTNAGMALKVHVVPKGYHNLVDLGKGGEGRGGRGGREGGMVSWKGNGSGGALGATPAIMYKSILYSCR